MSVHIRLATPQDYPAIAFIARQSQQLHAEAHPLLFAPDTPGFTEAQLREQMEEPQTVVYVAAEEEGQVIGYLFARAQQLSYLEIFLPNQIVVFITDIAVAESARGKGVGHLLFEAAASWAKSRQAVRLELTVYEFNANARAFYEKLGMQTLSRTMMLPLD